MQDVSYTESPSPVNGRLLIELQDGRLTIYPVTQSDEETRQLIAAVMEHIANACRR